MSNSFLELLKKQREFRESIIPQSVIDILEAKKRYESQLSQLKEHPAFVDAIPLQFNNAMAGTPLSSHLPHIAAAGLKNEVRVQSLAALGLSLKDIYPSYFAKAAAAAAGLINNTMIGKSLSFAISAFQEINSSPAKAITSSPATLNPFFSLGLQRFKSFSVPDFDEIDFDEEGEEEKKVSIIIGHDAVPELIMALYNDEEKFSTIAPHDFEKVIAELFKGYGYDVKLTKKTKDGGYDMQVQKMLEGNIPFRAIVECKRYNNTIGVDKIRSFSAVVQREKANKGIFVTTSIFSPEAKKENLMFPVVLDLKERNDIKKWLEYYVGKNMFLSKKRYKKMLLV